VYQNSPTKELDQGDIKCKISAVTTRTKRLSPDIVGVTSCYNASPIGQDWTVGVTDAFDPSSQHLPDDIQLDLYLSAIQI